MTGQSPSWPVSLKIDLRMDRMPRHPASLIRFGRGSLRDDAREVAQLHPGFPVERGSVIESRLCSRLSPVCRGMSLKAQETFRAQLWRSTASRRAAAPRASTLCWIQGKTQNGLCQFVNFARRDQPRGPVMLQNFGQLLQPAGDNTLAHRHVFKKLRGRPEEPAAVRHRNMR